MDHQHRLWSGLLGTTIVSWSGPRYPFDWTDDNDAESGIFTRSDAEFEQLRHLIIKTADGGVLSIKSQQDNIIFYLEIARDAPPVPRERDQEADFSGMPIGTIEAVALEGITGELVLKDGTVYTGDPVLQVVEATLTIDGKTVAIIAGEHQPDWDDGLHPYWADESVLVFDRAEKVNSLEWRGHRDDRVRIPLADD
jgi:hypothetical protein